MSVTFQKLLTTWAFVLSCPAHHCRTALNFFCTQYYANKCVRHIHNVLEARYISPSLPFSCFNIPRAFKAQPPITLLAVLWRRIILRKKRNVKWKKIKNQLPPNVEALSVLSPARLSRHRNISHIRCRWVGEIGFISLLFVSSLVPGSWTHDRKSFMYTHVLPNDFCI